MLQNQQNEITDPPKVSFSSTPSSADAAQVRVTPEELTQALNALQKSKEEEASQLNGTLSIGQAVDEMGLDSTPEEIWKHIQAQRLQKEQEAQRQQEQEAQRHEAEAQKQSIGKQAEAIAAGIAAGKIAYDAAHAAQQRKERKRRRNGPNPIFALLAVGCFFFFTGHGVMVNDSHRTTTYVGNHNVAMINGNDDTITFSGDCSILIVDGNSDHIVIEGHVKHVIANGNDNTAIWSKRINSEAPSIIDNGHNNTMMINP